MEITFIATVRKESEALNALKEKYPENLTVVLMDIGDTDSVRKAFDKVNLFAVHPGWIRTNGKEDNPAPLSSYDAAEIIRKLFEERRYDKTSHRFITNEGTDYPF